MKREANDLNAEDEMTTRRLLSNGVIVAIVIGLSVMAAPGFTQDTPPEHTTLKPKALSTPWVPPKTPWGDPNLEGVWTSDSAFTIPLERPSQFAGRAELSDAEYKQRAERDARARTAAEHAIGSFRGDSAWLNKSFRQSSLIVEPADGKIPPLTPQAERRRAPRDEGTFGDGPFDSPEDFTLYDRCITRGVVGSVLPVIYGNGNRILQTPGEVVITYEMVHDTRVIPLDGRPHIGQKIRQYLGDSRGHWEGRTLVVETTNLTDGTSIGANGNGLRHSADMKLIERFTRTDHDVLRYEVIIDDPKTYTRPWRLSLPLTAPAGFFLLPYECHEGNHAVFNSLSAERTEDKAVADDLKKGVIRDRRPVQGLSIAQTVGDDSALVPLLAGDGAPPER
jgi:hypothetical protein